MLDNWISPLTTFLTVNPIYGGFITFAFAFIESIAIIGSIIPGTVTMTAIGSLIGLNVLKLVPTLSWAIFGALVGDYLSYWLGRHFQDEISKWRITKHYQYWVDYAEKFIKKHGIMSVIIGRFFGPARSMIPMVAGFLNMSWQHFTIAVFPSAILWSIVYLTPGMLLGSLSSDFTGSIPLNIIGWSLLSIITILFSTKFFRFMMRQYSTPMNQKLSSFLKQHQRLNQLPWLSTEHELATRQLQFLGLALLYGFTVMVLAYFVKNYEWVAVINESLYAIVQNFWNTPLNKIMMSLTFLADKKVLIFTVCLSSIILFVKKESRATAVIWLGYTAMSALIIKAAKMGMHVQRPPIMAPILGHTSFPSGHVSFSTALTSFVGLGIIEKCKTSKYRNMSRRLILFIPIFVAVTRIYVGAHWLTDVIGGALVGLCLSYFGLFLTLPYLRVTHQKLLHYTTIISLVIGASVFGSLHFKLYFKTAFPKTNSIMITDHQWQPSHSKLIPLTRKNPLGHHRDILNIRIMGPITPIIQTLKKSKWHCYIMPNRQSLKQWLLNSQQKHCATPLIPPKLNGKLPSIIAMKRISIHHDAMLFIWPTQFRYHNKAVWLGTCFEVQNSNKPFPSWGHRYFSINATQMLNMNLNSKIQLIKPDKKLIKFDWDRKVLIAKT